VRKKNKSSNDFMSLDGEPLRDGEFIAPAAGGDPDHTMRIFLSLSPEEQSKILASMPPHRAERSRQRLQRYLQKLAELHHLDLAQEPAKP